MSQLEEHHEKAWASSPFNYLSIDHQIWNGRQQSEANSQQETKFGWHEGTLSINLESATLRPLDQVTQPERRNSQGTHEL